MTHTHINQSRKQLGPIEYRKEDLPGGPTVRVLQLSVGRWQLDLILDNGK